MADYAQSINSNDFLYQRKVYFTNPYVVFKASLVVKLTLTNDNFNFDLSQDDGSDFRLVDGVATLRMWKVHWSKTDRHAVLFFKLQNVGGGASVSYKAYWGNKTISANSEPETLDVLFYEDFNNSPLDSSKWEGSIANGVSTYGYLLKYGSSFRVTTKGSPLEGKSSWTIEAGLYCDWDTDGAWAISDYAMVFEFRGTENDMVVNVMSNTSIEHQIIQPGGETYEYSDKTHGGLEGRSQNDVFISYYEPNDTLEIRFLNRKTFGDVSHVISRKVEGDTRPTKLKIGGAVHIEAPKPSYIDWLVIREGSDTGLGELDGNELYIPYENVPHQTQDYKKYGPDITNAMCHHESTFGGDPYLLSNNIHDDDLNVWVSGIDAVTVLGGISLTIDMMGQSKTSVVDRSFKHYDSGHEYYYNASKLSDLNLDRLGRDFWHCKATSGWAAIRFPESRTIGSFKIKFNEAGGTGPKNYIFLGSNFYPGTYMELSKELDSGTFNNTLEWQSRKIKVPTRFKYYILDIKDTYGNGDIRLQEWRMSDAIGNDTLVYPVQLRLHPGTYGSYMDNFPKEIMFEGSLDGVNWVTLIPWVYTYTPYVEHYKGYEHWQRYSFVNIQGFWLFRLRCQGNWGASNGRIIIGGWSIHELAEEAYTYRILGGTSNKIQQIWAQEGTVFGDSHKMFYVANEKINTIIEGATLSTKDLPDYYEDFNVV